MPFAFQMGVLRVRIVELTIAQFTMKNRRFATFIKSDLDIFFADEFDGRVRRHFLFLRIRR